MKKYMLYLVSMLLAVGFSAMDTGALDSALSSVPRVSVSQPHFLVRRPASDRSRLFRNHTHVMAKGEVAVILTFHPAEDRYQKFMVRLSSGKLVLVVHDTAMAPCVENLNLGDRVAVCGEYSFGQNGNEIGWTHKDKDGQNRSGWLKHDGRIYE